MATILTPIQCKMARVALGWGIRELAAAAEVSTDTISRLERGDPLRDRTLRDIRRTLEEGGVTFINANGGGPGVRLK